MSEKISPARFFLIAALAACTLIGCHANSKDRIDLLNQSQYWINWQGTQLNYATPANIWRGFVANEAELIADYANPTIAFFLKEAAPREFVYIVYHYTMPGKIQVFVNGQSAAYLPHSPKFSQYSFSCTQLRKGFNQIRFAFADKSFHLHSVSLHKKGVYLAGRDLRELKETEEFEVYLLPGRVDFEIQGRASLRARHFGIIDDQELSTPISQTISVSEKKTVFSYNSPTPFVTSIRCLQGSAKISHLWYRINETKKSEPGISESALTFDKKKIKDIFIFLLDGAQAKHLRLYGYSRDTAPRISEFAKDSLVFKQAFCNASYTPGAVGSIFTGLYPDHHQVLSMIHVLDKNILTLPQFLKKHGLCDRRFYRQCPRFQSIRISSRGRSLQAIPESFPFRSKLQAGGGV